MMGVKGGRLEKALLESCFCVGCLQNRQIVKLFIESRGYEECNAVIMRGACRSYPKRSQQPHRIAWLCPPPKLNETPRPQAQPGRLRRWRHTSSGGLEERRRQQFPARFQRRRTKSPKHVTSPRWRAQLPAPPGCATQSTYPPCTRE